MKKLDIRFDKKFVDFMLSKLEEKELGTKSEIARAAMNYGLLKIQGLVDEFGADVATKSVQELNKTIEQRGYDK